MRGTPLTIGIKPHVDDQQTNGSLLTLGCPKIPWQCSPLTMDCIWVHFCPIQFCVLCIMDKFVEQEAPPQTLWHVAQGS